MDKKRRVLARSGKADVILGLQFGDEGKGKIIDTLCQDYDYVVRFQGGANSGHTINTKKGKVVLHILPSSALHSHVTSVIGAGVVINPVVLLDEIKQVKKHNPELRLIIDERAHLTFPSHIDIDGVWDEDKTVGSTKRGNSPTYVSKFARYGVQIGQMRDASIGDLKAVDEKLGMMFGVPANVRNGKEHKKSMMEWIEALSYLHEHIELADAPALLNFSLSAGKTVLLEGAQGTMLDINYGTYPDVSSSHVGTAGAFLGSGVSPYYLGRVIGIIKPYVTRVGTGEFPAEYTQGTEAYYLEAGNEYGSVTGRPRRIAMLHLPSLTKQIVRNGVTNLIITKIDVVDWQMFNMIGETGKQMYPHEGTKATLDGFLQVMTEYALGKKAEMYALSIGTERDDILYFTDDDKALRNKNEGTVLHTMTHSGVSFDTYVGMKDFELVDSYGGSNKMYKHYKSKADPVSLTAIKSGWEDVYHVIIEDGEMERSFSSQLTKEQIYNNFNIEL
jgi:adenylosuccinate synthase